MNDIETLQPRLFQHLARSIRQNRLHHAYVLVGTHESSLQRAFSKIAQVLLCQNKTQFVACGTCEGCRQWLAGNHTDAITLEPDEKQTLSIDVIRTLMTRIGYKTADEQLRLIAIVHADVMTIAAQNALLKTLEEPPHKTHFFLLTTRPKRLLPTLRSRTIRLNLQQTSLYSVDQVDTLRNAQTRIGRCLQILAADENVTDKDLELPGNVDKSLFRQLLAPETMPQTLKLANIFGQDEMLTNYALLVLESYGRDVLANYYGASDKQLVFCDALVPPTIQQCQKLTTGIQEARKKAVYHPNRTMLLESLLLNLIKT